MEDFWTTDRDPIESLSEALEQEARRYPSSFGEEGAE